MYSSKNTVYQYDLSVLEDWGGKEVGKIPYQTIKSKFVHPEFVIGAFAEHSFIMTLFKVYEYKCCRLQAADVKQHPASNASSHPTIMAYPPSSTPLLYQHFLAEIILATLKLHLHFGGPESLQNIPTSILHFPLEYQSELNPEDFFSFSS